MKIRHTHIGKPPSTPTFESNPASSRFSTLLQDEIDATSDTSTSQKQNDPNTFGQKKQLWTLIEDAAHLLDDIIGQIATDGKPDPASVDSLQQLMQVKR